MGKNNINENSVIIIESNKNIKYIRAAIKRMDNLINDNDCNSSETKLVLSAILLVLTSTFIKNVADEFNAAIEKKKDWTQAKITIIKNMTEIIETCPIYEIEVPKTKPN
jgi:hypothetical protein